MNRARMATDRRVTVHYRGIGTPPVSNKPVEDDNTPNSVKTADETPTGTPENLDVTRVEAATPVITTAIRSWSKSRPRSRSRSRSRSVAKKPQREDEWGFDESSNPGEVDAPADENEVSLLSCSTTQTREPLPLETPPRMLCTNRMLLLSRMALAHPSPQDPDDKKDRTPNEDLLSVRKSPEEALKPNVLFSDSARSSLQSEMASASSSLPKKWEQPQTASARPSLQAEMAALSVSRPKKWEPPQKTASSLYTMPTSLYPMATPRPREEAVPPPYDRGNTSLLTMPTPRPLEDAVQTPYGMDNKIESWASMASMPFDCRGDCEKGKVPQQLTSNDCDDEEEEEVLSIQQAQQPVKKVSFVKSLLRWKKAPPPPSQPPQPPPPKPAPTSAPQTTNTIGGVLWHANPVPPNSLQNKQVGGVLWHYDDYKQSPAKDIEKANVQESEQQLQSHAVLGATKRPGLNTVDSISSNFDPSNEKSSCYVRGVEMDNPVLGAAKRLGFNTYDSEKSFNDDESSSFDVITLAPVDEMKDTPHAILDVTKKPELNTFEPPKSLHDDDTHEIKQVSVHTASRAESPPPPQPTAASSEEKKSAPSWIKVLFCCSVAAVLIMIAIFASLLLSGYLTEVKIVPVVNVSSPNSTTGDDGKGNESDVPVFFSTVNEFCSGAVAVEVAGSPYRGSTSESSWDPIIDTCGSSMSFGHSAWFKFIATESRLMEASTCVNTDFDTQLTISSGDACESLSCVTFDDQGCGDQSKATWFANKGQTYFIAVHGFREVGGNFSLELSPAESNDECLKAKGPVLLGSSVFGTTSGASVYTVPSCEDLSTSNPGVWYVMDKVEGSVRVEAISRDLGFVTQVAVFNGAACNGLKCQVASSSGSANFTADGEATYYVFVNGLNTKYGDFDLSISWDLQDTCDYAVSLTPKMEPFTSSTRNSRIQHIQACKGQGFHTAPGMWFTVQGTGQILSATTCSKKFNLDTQISVFRGGCDALECVGGTDQDQPCDVGGTFTWATELGSAYFIYVSGRNTRVGDFALTVVEHTVKGGNACSAAVTLGSTTLEIAGSTVNATETDIVCGDISVTRGVWYEFVGTGSLINAWTCNPLSSFDVRFSIFTGSCDSLECAAYSPKMCSEADGTPFRFQTIAGERYYMLVHGNSTDTTGDFVLSMKDEDKNDSCSAALAIGTSSQTYFGNTATAVKGAFIPCEGENSTSIVQGLWYSFVGTGDNITMSTCSQETDFATEMSVFSGQCDELTCISTSENFCGTQSVVSFFAEKDEQYFIRVHGANATEMGNYALSVSVRSVFFGW